MDEEAQVKKVGGGGGMWCTVEYCDFFFSDGTVEELPKLLLCDFLWGECEQMSVHLR